MDSILLLVSISPEVKTYSVAFFENKLNTINSSLSSTFTEKLKDYFSSQLNIQQIETEGDLSFSGEIVNYEIKPITFQMKP